MKQQAFAALLLVVCSTFVRAQQPEAVELEIRQWLRSYAETYNGGDAEAVAKRWKVDAVSVQEETGERTEGRESLTNEFARFFADYPDAHLSGVLEHIKAIGNDAALVEGRVSLLLGEESATETLFTAVLEREGGEWLIASSHERDVPQPASPYDALRELEWLVGAWRDETEGARATSTVGWSPNEAFLIRSYEAEFADGESFSGTQIFGWDPMTQEIRTWTFNSDGTFGDGVVSRSGEDWMVKLNQVQIDGRLATGVTVITLLDEDTLQVQKIAESIDGEPLPVSEPIIVARAAEEFDAEVGSTNELEREGR